MTDSVPNGTSWWARHSDAVVVGLLTTIVAGGGVTLWNLNSQVVAIGTRLEASDNRVDRIASALPDIGIRVATEDLFRQYDFAAVQLAIDELRSRLVIIDLNRKTREIWTSPESITNPTVAEAAVTGAVVISSEAIYSFADLSSAANDIGQMMSYPGAVTAKASWAGIGTPAALKAQLAGMGWENAGTTKLEGAGQNHYQGILDRVSEVIATER